MNLSWVVTHLIGDGKVIYYECCDVIALGELAQ
jgi:hypothetical protein